MSAQGNSIARPCQEVRWQLHKPACPGAAVALRAHAVFNTSAHHNPYAQERILHRIRDATGREDAEEILKGMTEDEVDRYVLGGERGRAAGWRPVQVW